jgi:hypothetical protein
MTPMGASTSPAAARSSTGTARATGLQRLGTANCGPDLVDTRALVVAAMAAIVIYQYERTLTTTHCKAQIRYMALSLFRNTTGGHSTSSSVAATLEPRSERVVVAHVCLIASPVAATVYMAAAKALAARHTHVVDVHSVPCLLDRPLRALLLMVTCTAGVS